MSFPSPIKLGIPRKELSFTVGTDEISGIRINYANDEVQAKNAIGESFRRVFRRASPIFTIQIPKATEATVQKILSLRHIDNQPLSFYYQNSFAVWSERYLTDGTASLTLDSSPMTRLGKAYKDAGGSDGDIIAISGVFTTYDAGGGQGGTNYYNGGGAAYAASTRIVTLTSSPGAAGTEVFVNWSYKGALVLMGQPAINTEGGWIAGTPYWDVGLELKGV